eukprot:56171-Eustigmatos_ZCMA.PRE.1
MLTICEGLAEFPDLDSLKDHGQILCCFDNLCLERDQSKIAQIYIRGRKIGGGISVCYLTQNYYSVPKHVRTQ